MERIFNVTDFGAVSGVPELQTRRLQDAIDACFLAGGGEVVVPAGTFRTATLRLRSRVTLHLLEDAVLEGSMDPADYNHFLEDTLEPIEIKEEPNFGKNPLEHPWYNALIRGYNAHDIRIIGEKNSFIDGKNCFNPEGEEKFRGPHAIGLFRCTNVEFCGYTVRDSANWAHINLECRNLFAHNITVLAGHDGFHCRSCDNLVIEDCEFYTGDDCIAGYDNQNVVIRRCLLDCACSAMRFGGTDVLVDSCRTHAPSRYGFRGSLSPEEKAASAPTNETHRHAQHTPFLYFCCFPTKIRKTPGNIIIQNCEFESPNSFFRLWFDGRSSWCTNRSLASITFRNCRAWGLSMPMEIYCPTEEPIHFRLENVEIAAREGYEKVDFIRTSNFAEIVLDNVTVKGYENPTIRMINPGKLMLRDTEGIATQVVEKF